jgi:hypothetical protein
MVFLEDGHLRADPTIFLWTVLPKVLMGVDFHGS